MQISLLRLYGATYVPRQSLVIDESLTNAKGRIRNMSADSDVEHKTSKN
jgi:hypothetical protein